MSINRVITYITVGVLVLAISVPSVLLVIKRHNERVLYATTTKIKEKAKECLDQEICTNSKVTLKELYDRGFLEEMANPLTKEYYNANSYVVVEDNYIQFIEVKE